MKRLACTLLFASTLMAAEPQCQIRGIVVDGVTNQTLPGTKVFTDADPLPDDDSEVPVRQITDRNGAFCFENLAAGNYSVRASRAFYVGAIYGEHWPGGPGRSLEVVTGQSRPLLRIKMLPQAIISGELVDADGDPVQGARIELVKRRWKERRLTTGLVQQTTTDDQGRYRFGRLPAGTYFISACPAPDFVNGPPGARKFLDQSGRPFRRVEGATYYADSISFRDATPIRVKAGQEISNLTLGLRTAEARHVSGQVAAEVRTLLFSEKGSENHGVWFSVPVQEDGHFVADGLFPGHYEVRGPGIVRKEIDLTSGDIDNLALESSELIELEITIHLEGANSQPPIQRLSLVDKARASDEGIVSVHAERISKNTFEAVAHPGEYEIALGFDGSPYFVTGLTVDKERQSRNVFELKGGARRSIELFLSSKVARIDGRVIGDGPIKNEITLLLEDESDPRSSFTKQSSSDGTFEWTLLQSGKYRLYAFEAFNSDAWGSPELAQLFAEKSVAVEVKEGQQLHLTVPLIAADDFQAPLQKLGL